jgi:hypothetical protein
MGNRSGSKNTGVGSPKSEERGTLNPRQQTVAVTVAIGKTLNIEL